MDRRGLAAARGARRPVGRDRVAGGRQRVEGADQLARAEREAAAIESVLLAGEAGRIAERAGLGGSKSRPRLDAGADGIDRLTSREREVLELVASGATNRQIASTLFNSDKTASVPVSRILGKLA